MYKRSEDRLIVASLKDQLSFLIEGANVDRYHTRPGIRSNKVGHHSHGVVMLMWLVSDGQVSAKALMAAGSHDLAEQVTSDVSSPAKRMLGIRKQLQDTEDKVLGYMGFKFDLTPEEDNWLSLADLFNQIMYYCDEAALGNKYVHVMMTRTCEYVEADLRLEPHQRNVFDALVELYKENTADGPSFDCYYR